MDRITNKQLQNKVDIINQQLGRPSKYSEVVQSANGGFNRPCIGHLFIDHYNPGDNPYQFKLAELMESYGEHNLTNYRMTRKEFDKYLTGILEGLELRKGIENDYANAINRS